MLPMGFNPLKEILAEKQFKFQNVPDASLKLIMGVHIAVSGLNMKCLVFSLYHLGIALFKLEPLCGT